MNTSVLEFQNTHFDITDINGQSWLRLPQIGAALGYANPYKAQQVFDRNADEFTDSMTQVVELQTAGGKQQVRVFSLRGAHLLGMLARTKAAKEFRRWVLDVLEQEAKKAVRLAAREDLLAQTRGENFKKKYIERAEAQAEMLSLLHRIEEVLRKSHCGANLDDQIRIIAHKSRFELDFFQLSALNRKLLDGVPERIMDKHPEIRRLKDAHRYSFDRPAENLPAPAQQPAAPIPAETGKRKRRVPTPEEAEAATAVSNIAVVLSYAVRIMQQAKELSDYLALLNSPVLVRMTTTAAEMKRPMRQALEWLEENSRDMPKNAAMNPNGHIKRVIAEFEEAFPPQKGWSCR